jgi:ABC-type uncharacterized transport system ATPase subunit
MADIQELCDRVIVIHKGTKIYDGALDRLEGAGHSKTSSPNSSPAGFLENNSILANDLHLRPLLHSASDC